MNPTRAHHPNQAELKKLAACPGLTASPEDPFFLAPYGRGGEGTAQMTDCPVIYSEGQSRAGPQGNYEVSGTILSVSHITHLTFSMILGINYYYDSHFIDE